MLFALHIRNIALLDDVEIEFQNGLNILTGETGAGKSILIGSINLLLGMRANRELIRRGADRAEVSGLFYVENDALRGLLTEQGIMLEEDGSLLLSRQLLKDGKNICRIGGRPATLAELKQISHLLVNIHGQHDSQALLDAASHIHFLDSFLKDAGEKAMTAYQAAFSAWRNLQKKAEEMDMDEAERLRKIDMLSFEADEIRSAAITPEEEEDLIRRRDIADHKNQLEISIAAALNALSEGTDEMPDARQALAVASDALESAVMLDDSLEPLNESLQTVLEETEELSRSLRNYFELLAEDEMPIDEIESRLDTIYRLKRKYGATVEAVLAHGAACEAELARLQNAEAEKEEMEQKLAEAEAAATAAADRLTTLRQKATTAITKAINENLHFLNMPDADFKIVLTPVPLHRYGAEQVSFVLQTNSGEDYQPLHKIVSGGELSRIMLAIKSVLTDGDSAETLIFDEIDTGVSGMAAQKIGRKLRSLSQNKQVLCVTHLAQIAAMANVHFLIKKSTAEGRTKTEVLPLSHKERVQELARIISGEAVTETTLKQAEELIAFGDEHD